MVAPEVDRVVAPEGDGAPGSLELGVLGPLRVAVDGAPVELGGRAGALLLLLALREGAPLPADQLADRLWHDDPPADPRNALQALVSRTRRALGPAGSAIVTEGGGYALAVPPAAVDAARLESAVGAARSGRADPAQTAAALDAALASWRGDPYVEVADDPDAIVAGARLAALRLEAIELRAELALRLGDSDAWVPRLRAAAAADPTRERLHRALAESLYRAGHQAEALAVLERLIGRLRDELGLDPDPRTTALQQALLRHDDRLSARAASGRRTAQPRPLPEARTSFVGRDDECRGVAAALAESRLVTLIGPGGSGKTRLAVEVARRVTGEAVGVGGGAAGVAYVELAALTDPADVVSQLAGGLGLDLDVTPGVGREPSPARSLEARVAEHLRDSRLLVVLDNCEHLVDAAAEAVELILDAGPRVRVLATSREGLRVPGEVLWPVPPLAVPEPGEAADPHRDGGDAVALFVDRARAVDVRFELDDRTQPAVVEVCRRLDGLPLAIELAAARIATLPVTVLAERLGDRFRLLTGGRRAVRRQETLEAVVEWSHELLDERQRLLFHRLGAFAGPVPVELVEAVVADDRLPAGEVLPVLAELADRSLMVLDGAGPALQVRMLETIRSFARHRLLASGDAIEVRSRHARAMAERAARAARGIRGPHQLEWLDGLDAELDEYRAALSWSVAAEPAVAVAIAAELGWYWWLHDHRPEAIRILQRVLAAVTEPDASHAATPAVSGAEAASDVADAATTALTWAWLAFLLSFDNRLSEAAAAAECAAAQLARAGAYAPDFIRVGVPLLVAYVETVCTGDYRTGRTRMAQAVTEAEAIGEDWAVAAGRYVLAGLADLADPSRMVEEAEAALAASQRIGDRWGEFQTRLLLATERTRAGDYPAAKGHLDRAILLGEQIGTREQVRATRVGRASVDMLEGDLEAARHQIEEVLRGPPVHARDLSQSIAYVALGMVLRRSGHLDAAAAAYRRARDGFLEAEAPLATAEALAGLVHVEVARDDRAAARSALASAVDHARAAPWPLGRTLPFLLEAAGALALADGDATLAARRLGRAAALRERQGGDLRAGERFDVDRVIGGVRELLGSRSEGVIGEGRDRSGLLTPID